MEDERFLKAFGEYETKGFGYINYPKEELYGIAIGKPSWFISMIEKYNDVRVVNFTERGWVDLQDVIACTREPIYMMPEEG